MMNTFNLTQCLTDTRFNKIQFPIKQNVKLRFKTTLNIKEFKVKKFRKSESLTCRKNLQLLDKVLWQDDQTLKQVKSQQLTLSNFNKIIVFKPQDQKKINRVGMQSSQKYFQHYKNLKQIQDQNCFTDTKESIYTNVLSNLEEKQLIPCKMDLVKFKGNQTNINITNRSYGDKYFSILSQGLENSDINELNIGGNRITEKSATVFFENLRLDTKSLNMRKNKIGIQGCQSLIQYFAKDAKLVNLNLEENNLGNNGVRVLLQALMGNQYLKKLDISKNNLNDQISQTIKEFSLSNKKLKEFYLSWNVFKQQTLKNIFNALQTNNTLRVLDISWNSLGNSDPQNFNELQEFFIKNSGIIHIDLSFNKFTLQECQKISESIQGNQTIMGLHLQGEFGYTDYYGNYIINEKKSTQKDINSVFRRINGCFHNKPINAIKDQIIISYCWLCNYWQNFDFTWKVGQSNENLIQGPVFLHLEFENYRGIYMGCSSKLTLNLKKMIPISQFQFFFTVNKKITNNNLYPIRIFRTEKVMNVFVSIQDIQIQEEFMHQQKIKAINFMQYDNELKEFVDPQTYEFSMPNRPREKVELIDIEQTRWRKAWLIKNSIFNSHKKLININYDKYFNYDINLLQLKILTFDDQDLVQTKSLLQQIYSHLIFFYQQICANNQNSLNQYFTSQQLYDLFISLKIGDSTTITDQFINKCMHSFIYSLKQEGVQLYEKGGNRLVFLNIFIKTAEIKMQKQFGNQNLSYYIKSLYEIYLKPSFEHLELIHFRQFDFHTEETDLVLNQLLMIPQYLFDQKSETIQTEKYISYDKFISIFQDNELFTENLQEKDINLCFNLSKQFQFEELNNQFLQYLTYLEFLEALSRCSMRLPNNLKEIKQKTSQNYLPKPLHIKLQQLLMFLYDKFNRKIKDDITLPEHPLFINDQLNLQFY